MNRKKAYPLYETTVFRDFRVMVEQSAENFPDKPAISYKKNPRDEETVRVTYAESRDNIRNLGTEEIALGLRDKKVAIVGGASVGWIYSYFSLMAVGAVTVPLDKEMPAPDLAATIERASCYAIFYGAEIAGKLDYLKENTKAELYVCMNGDPLKEGDLALASLIEEGGKKFAEGDNSYYDYEIDPDRLATIVFTSGTTGKGKGVMLSQTNIVTDMTQGMYLFDITRKTLNVLPPHHTFGSTVNYVGHYAQGCEIYITSGIKYLLNELKEQQPTHLVLVPLFVETLYRRIWATAEKTGADKKLKTGMKVSKALRKIGIDKRRSLFAQVHETFGGKLLAESSNLCCSFGHCFSSSRNLINLVR